MPPTRRRLGAYITTTNEERPLMARKQAGATATAGTTKRASGELTTPPRKKRNTAATPTSGWHAPSDHSSSPSHDDLSSLVVERAPTSRAKCHGCGKPIDKGDGRVGSPYKLEIGSHVFDKLRYYHEHCCPDADNEMKEALKKKLRAIDKQKARDEKLVHETRAELRQRLTKLRLKLFEEQAEKGGSAVILSLSVIDNIVLAMPKTMGELGLVKGIGPTILREYGEPLLKEVRRFRRDYPDNDGSEEAGSSDSDRTRSLEDDDDKIQEFSDDEGKQPHVRRRL